jgi:FMN-dependent oxidoreductase (nitrilotriacetate monooxygenase family)
MDGQARQMTLVGFMQAQNCSLLTASWRHPQSRRDFLSPDYFQSMARALEAAHFQLAFFDDRLAMPDIYKNNHDFAVRHGIRPVKLDPIPVLSAMAAVTQHIGLGATYSTTYYEPFHVARLFQTLDHMTGGRAAWNVVTSLNSSEAENFGRESHLEHDLRYDRAEEFMEVVLGLWDSWDPDALVVDKQNRIFADPSKVRRLDYAGKYFHSRGPLTVPASPQGHPVIIQAGQSGRGSEFAAKWAELIFALYPNIEVGKQVYKKVKDQIRAAGRDPDPVRIAPAAYVVVGETKSEAEDKVALLDKLTEEVDGLVLLSENLSYDFSKKGLEDEFTNEELQSINGMRALRDKVLLLSKKTNPTLRDFITFSRKGSVHEHILFCGSPTDVADQMEKWFVERACDGFVIAATHMPGSFEEFGKYVTPELQRRGLLQTAYAGKTLRENLGLGAGPKPTPVDVQRSGHGATSARQ